MARTMKKLATFALAAPLAAMLVSCYSSAGPGREDADVPPDSPPDTVQDVLEDEAVPPVDVMDVTPDLPPDLPPFTGATFVVTNATGYPLYLNVWDYGVYPSDDEYDLSLAYLPSGPSESRYLWQPWCTVDCSTVTDPMYCCMDCYPPWVDAVLMLDNGESLRIPWTDGMLYGMNYEVCDCGCYDHFHAANGPYRASICGSPRFICYTDIECNPDELGVIHNAGLGDIMTCTEISFSVPEVSGGEIVLFFAGETP
jgi:hypothetical protein